MLFRSRPQAKAAPEKQAGTAAQPAASPRQGNAELNAQMQAYYAKVWSRIRGGWTLPQGIVSGEVLETVIGVTVLRSGAVTEVNYEKRSGNRYFDESAMKAVRKASPFPPLPAGVGDNSIDIGIRFPYPEPRR